MDRDVIQGKMALGKLIFCLSSTPCGVPALRAPAPCCLRPPLSESWGMMHQVLVLYQRPALLPLNCGLRRQQVLGNTHLDKLLLQNKKLRVRGPGFQNWQQTLSLSIFLPGKALPLQWRTCCGIVTFTSSQQPCLLYLQPHKAGVFACSSGRSDYLWWQRMI